MEKAQHIINEPEPHRSNKAGDIFTLQMVESLPA
ncbi:Uncharacterised protein [Listeria grayi]|uniref:Uncharacterized protein n=1 Tax=Listeria grayi TaxID=1641 RepID=A0A378MEC7_LISGR|nr:Uncharacterised protein [Listeria grayi]